MVDSEGLLKRGNDRDDGDDDRPCSSRRRGSRLKKKEIIIWKSFVFLVLGKVEKQRRADDFENDNTK